MDLDKGCNCKSGQCRQLYCICLKRGVPCRPGICNCTGCENDERQAAIEAREKQREELQNAVRKGCNCKNNYCKKNYCICHAAGLKCDPRICNCHDCYNYVGAPPLPDSFLAKQKGGGARKHARKM